MWLDVQAAAQTAGLEENIRQDDGRRDDDPKRRLFHASQYPAAVSVSGRILGMNGEQDSLVWKNRVFSPLVNSLIGEIVQLGGEADLERSFDHFRKEFEPALRQIRDRLMNAAMDRGLEP